MPAINEPILKIPKFLSFVEEKFGKVGVQEYLYHIKEDYEKSRAYKLAKIILKFKFWWSIHFQGALNYKELCYILQHTNI